MLTKSNSATKKSRGFGFVTFSSAAEAERAIKTMNKKVFHGKPLHVTAVTHK